ncbi:MAG: cupin domain-containing protein [Congregibacter sp.]
MSKVRQILVLMLIAFAAQAFGEISPLATNLADANWSPPGDGSISPAGTRTAPLATDEATGGITYYAHFPAGGHFDLHWHTYDEYAVVVSDSLTIRLDGKDQVLTAGAFVAIPGGAHHSWDIPPTGDAVIVVKRSGPPDFHFVNR